MARIRTIKPEFPQSENVGRLSRDARLLFVQIWTVVDDYGRARAAHRLLCGQLYPYDDDAPKLIGKWLAELAAENLIRLYQVDGSQYLDIPTWGKHQRIDNAGKSSIPAFCSDQEIPRGETEDIRREPPRTAATDGEPPLDLGEGKDLGKEKDSRAIANATRPDRSEVFERFWKSYPRREGANPKAPAQKAFDAAIKRGVDPEAIIAGAKRCAQADSAKIGTPYIPQAVKWLHDRRWEDYAAQPLPCANGPSVDEFTPEIWNQLLSTFRKFGRWNESTYGSEPGRPGCRVPPEILSSWEASKSQTPTAA